MLRSYRENPALRKRMRIMLICVGILFGLIFLYKGFMSLMIKHYFATHQNPIVTVSTTKAVYTTWQNELKSVGSMRAIKGVDVTTELAGIVQTIYFKPGDDVEEGDLLVQLNSSNEIATLRSLQAQTELAKITYQRDQAQFKVNAISKQQLDSDQYNLQNLEAQVAAQAATVAKKVIRAPFTGRLGISRVNPGQYLNVGDPVTTLQTIDPIYVDFYLPQQALADLKLGQTVNLTSDTFPNKLYSGKITTIQPAIDTNTRNVEVEATVENPTEELTPGMYVNVKVVVGSEKEYLTLPQSAITFNPYGNIVFLVQKNKNVKDENGKPELTVTQIFVTTGATRGDQIAILDGLKKGDIVVSSGQLKLKNGSRIAVNNKVVPPNEAAPKLTDDHQG